MIKFSYVTRSIGASLSLCLGLCVANIDSVMAQSYSSNSSQQQTERGALGLVVNWNPQRRLTVNKVVPGGPAAKAGIKLGDILLSIDGVNVGNLPPNQIFSRMLGNVGTTTVLSLSSPTRGSYNAKLKRVTVSELKKSSSFDIGWQPAQATPGNAMASAGGNYSGSSGSSYSGTTSGTTSNPGYNNNNGGSNYGNGTSTSGNVAWNTYGGADDGFSVRYPQGWSVKQNEKTGRVEVKSAGGSQLSIFPFFLPSQAISANQAQGLFEAMLKQYAGGTQWSRSSYVGGGLRAMSTSNNVNSLAGLALSKMTGGTAGRLIIFQVPNNSNAQNDLSTLAQILNSFTITGGAVGNNETGSQSDYSNASAAAQSLPYQNVQFTKFVDPNFNAFSLDVPAGWIVKGGMKKPMPIDLRPWVQASSPDQKILIFIGDGSICPRYLPAQWLNFLGRPPGSNYRVSNGLQTKVLYYQSADKFVQNYAKSRFRKLVDGMELVDVQQLPDIVRDLRNIGGTVAAHAAFAKYNFTNKGKPGVAYFMAATRRGQKMWWVAQISGVVATLDCEQQALSIFLRMYKSWQYGTQFTQNQNRQNIASTQSWMAYDSAARARSAAAFRSRMAAMDARHNAFMARSRASDAAHARYMNKVRSSDRAHSDFINFIRDEDTLMNPSTGTKYQVEYGPKYHWVNSTGDTTIGTNSAWSPGVDWTELVTPPKP